MNAALLGCWALLVAAVSGARIAPRWAALVDAWRLPPALSPDLMAHWGDVAWASAWLALFALAALAAGRSALAWLGVNPAVGERPPVRIITGIALHAGVALALGLCGLLYPAIAAAGVALLILGARPGVVWGRRTSRTPLPVLGWTCRAVTIGAALFLLLLALAPQWFVDTLAYHLAAPAHFNKLHRWTDTPHSTYRYTLLAEHLLGQALLIGGETLASLLHAAAEVLIAWLGFAWVARVVGPAAGWVAAASLLACLPLGVILKHDVFSVAFAFLAAWAAFGRGPAPSQASLLLAGAAAGWAFCAKYTAGAVAAGVAAGVLALPDARRSGSRLRPIAAGFAAVSLPWLAKTWGFTGNPFFSFVFDGTQWNGENHAAVAAFGCPGYSWAPGDPRGIVMAVSGMLARELPFVLLAIPAMLRPLPGARAGFMALGVSLALLVVGAPCERLLIPVVPLLTVIAVLHYSRQEAAGRGIVAWSPAVLILAASAGAHAELSFGRRPLAAALGLESRESFRARVLTTHARAARDLEAVIPDDQRLLVVGDSRGYLFRQVTLTRDITDTSLALRMARRSVGPERMRIRFRQRRIGYVLFNYVSAEYRGYFKGPIFRWKADELHRHWAFWRRHSTRVPFATGEDGENGGFVLYRIQQQPRDDDRVLAFLPGATAVGVRWPGEDAGEALARLGGVVRAAPNVAMFELNYCRLLCEVGRFAEAERRLAAILRAPYPRIDQVHALLGVALLGRGAREKAHEHFRIARELRPDESGYLALESATGWHGIR